MTKKVEVRKKIMEVWIEEDGTVSYEVFHKVNLFWMLGYLEWVQLCISDQIEGDVEYDGDEDGGLEDE